MDSITKEIRKLLMAGLGAAAEGKEQGEKLLDRLAEKGEATLQQGKVMNEELKRSIRRTLSEEEKAADVLKAVDDMDAEQLEALKARIASREEARAAEESGQKTEADAVN